jgi:CTP-dependent riboflavin kinase
LNEDDAQTILLLKDELVDNWHKKQIFRTETEMRVSVLNDAKHPTPASKYWQSVREMSAHFDNLIDISFEIRRNTIQRLRLEKKMEKALDKGDELKQMELQVDLDENLYRRVCMEQIAHDRVREIQTWSKLKSELDDGTFDTQNVNTHQAKSLKLYLENRAKSLNPNSEVSEVMNALGPLNTINRLSTEDGKLLTFTEAKLQLKENLFKK